MNRFLSSTAAVSIALMNVQPWPLMAQTLTDTGSVIAVDGTVLCEPSADAPCDPAAPDLTEAAQAIEAQLAADAEAAAAQAALDAEAAAAAAQAALDAEAEAAAAQAALDAEAEAAAAQAALDAEAEAAAAQAALDAEAEAAAAQAALDAEAEAAAAQAALDAEAEAAAAQAALDAEAEAAAAQAALDAEAEAAAQAALDAEAEAAAQAALDAEAEAAAAQATAEAAAEAAVVVPVEPAAEIQPETAPEATVEAAPAEVSPEEIAAQAAAQAEAEAAARAQAEAELKTTADGTIVDPAAGLKTAEEVIDPAAPTVEAPVVSEAEVQALSDLLAVEAPVEAGTAAVETAAPTAAAALVDTGPAPVDAAPSAAAVSSTSEVVTEATTRSATQEFSAAPQVVAPGQKNRLSDLEKAGLVVLGGLAVGAIISSANRTANAPQQQVVSNTGDRVVVLQPDGNYQVFKDDDALLRRPGNEVRTETFSDGSTRTIVDRADGSQIVTIRNATGRVLRRAQYDARGQERLLINDLVAERPIVVSALPKPRGRPVVISPRDGDAAIKAAIAARQIEQLGRNFSLRQVRDIPQVRRLAAMIDVEAVTFASGSSALTTQQVDALTDLGAVMQDLLDANPGEVFLVEGHTDAVGSGALNLALSDRRAETVALALTQYFDIPPENMVVQGYGETELLIDTQANEARNRRVGVRVITPLL